MVRRNTKLLVGLTGGIGSGKTVVSDYFAELGVPVVDTDIVAREVVSPGSEALENLLTAFGKKIIDKHGNLKRDVLRAIAFSTPENKKKLDDIMHPVIREQTFKQIDQTHYAYCIVVVPLLIETDFKQWVDRILLVTAETQDRVNWIKKRSALSTEEIHHIMQSQTQDKIRLQFADDLIKNNSSITAVQSQALALHKKYLELGKH